MRPSSFTRHPPVIVLGLALILTPMTLNSRRSPSPQHLPGAVQHNLLPSRGTSSSDVSNSDASSQESGEQPASIHQPDSPPVTASSAPSQTGTEVSLPFGIQFSLPPIPFIQQAVSPVEANGPYELDALFEGNSYSLVATAVGAAEGTRTPSGGYTKFFNGHTDPGNGVWNLGTFSYQHGAASPEEADRKQLQRLKGQADDIRYRAARAGIQLGLEEELNGIDLANQSPLAALGKPGYAEWLAEAYQRGLRGQEAILWARVKGYWDVQRGRWNAPGLGNTEPLIRRDQNRRMQAVAQAIAQHSLGASLGDRPSPTQFPASLPPKQSSSPAAASSESNTTEFEGGDRPEASPVEPSQSSQDDFVIQF